MKKKTIFLSKAIFFSFSTHTILMTHCSKVGASYLCQSHKKSVKFWRSLGALMDREMA